LIATSGANKQTAGANRGGSQYRSSKANNEESNQLRNQSGEKEMEIEQDAIQDAYRDEVKGMFNPFFVDFLQHGPDAAADKFTKGLKKLLEARDLALKSIPKTADRESPLNTRTRTTRGRRE
jgi:hypothetical protein